MWVNVIFSSSGVAPGQYNMSHILLCFRRDCGLEQFVPPSLLDSMKGKDVRKMIQQYLKMNQSLSAPGQKQLTALQAKLHYLKIISELKTFGSRIFMVTLLVSVRSRWLVQC